MSPNQIVHYLYSMLGTAARPGFVPGSYAGATGTILFVLSWSVLPFLYTVYFSLMWAASWKMSRWSGAVQRVLCGWCIIHFLFLTDMVDYKFGRGITNSNAEWYHWNERLVWRIAICLPIYQKVATGHWKNYFYYHRVLGDCFHYFLGAWGSFFFVYQCILHDVP